jgi:SNF2 family DNA or RNA helicase
MRIEAHMYDHRGTPRIAAVFYEDPESAAIRAKEVTNSRRFYKNDALPASATAGGTFAAHYPASVDKCLEMREVWADALKVHRDLGDWYRAASVERAAQVAITTQADVKLERVPALYPELNAYLKGDQRVTAHWIANAYRGGGLLADEVGTGKTVGVVAGLIEAGITGHTLIVCPRISVKAVWYKEITKHTDIPVYACQGKRSKRQATVSAYYADPSPFKVLVVVSEMLRIKAFRSRGRIEDFIGYEYPELFETEWDAVVVDESHKLLGAMDVVRATLAGEGLRALQYAPNRLKLAVSATPFGKGGRVEAMFGTLHWLWPDEHTSRWGWLGRYFTIIEDRVFVRGGGGMTKTVRKVGGLKSGITEQAFWDSLGPRVLRRTMDDVSPAHRGLKNYVTVPCEMEEMQLKQYRAFAEDGELAVEGGIITTVGMLDYLTRSRQFANGALRKEGGRVVYTGESCKIDKLIAHLDRLDPNRKAVISSQYNEFLDAVEKRLGKEGYGYYRLDGKTTEARREVIMNAFQDNDLVLDRVTCPICHAGRGKVHGTVCLVKRPRLFLLNSQAGGVSITLDAAEELHQLDRMYPPEANTQLYGRIFRRGRAHQVFLYLYEAMGTIDEEITANTEEGHEEQMKVLDGRRGKEYVRELAQYRPEGEK